MSTELKKLVVFANDPLKEYYLKGELTNRYFNPCNFFDEVYFISLSDNDIAEEEIKSTVGLAKLKIFSVGAIGLWIFFPFSIGRKKILRLIKEIRPDCIRVYNAHVQGFLGACLSGKLNIPLVVSLHTNPEKSIRIFLNPFRHTFKWLFWNMNKYIIESIVINRADKIICVYKFIYDFADKVCKKKDKIELIYNKIDMDQFKPVEKPVKCGDTVKILCVGRLFKGKNPEYLIKAMPEINAKLTIIGDGPYRFIIQELIDKLNLRNKVSLITSVPNIEIHRYYQDADIFVSVTNFGETSKVMIEAMASGLPIVINRSRWGKPELLEDTVVVVDNSPVGFAKALKILIDSKETRLMLGIKNRERVLKINNSIMEEKEMLVYKNIVNYR